MSETIPFRITSEDARHHLDQRAIKVSSAAFLDALREIVPTHNTPIINKGKR